MEQSSSVQEMEKLPYLQPPCAVQRVRHCKLWRTGMSGQTLPVCFTVKYVFLKSAL